MPGWRGDDSFGAEHAKRLRGNSSRRPIGIFEHLGKRFDRVFGIDPEFAERSRRPFADNDRGFLEWLRPAAASRLVLLSKADKLSRAEQAKTLAHTRRGLDAAALTSEVMLFSSKSGAGVVETRALLDSWLRNKKAIL